MVLYYCFRCGKEYNKKSNWKNHLKRKNPCKVIYLDCDGKYIINNYEELLPKFNREVMDRKKIYKCSKCNFKTEYKRSLRRHQHNDSCRKESLEEEVSRLRLLVEESINNRNAATDEDEDMDVNDDTDKDVKDIDDNKTKKMRAQVRYKRIDILKKGNNLCVICDDKILGLNFEVDHLIPVAIGGPNSDENLAVMCCNCHGNKTRYIDKIIKDMVKSGMKCMSRIDIINFVKSSKTFLESCTKDHEESEELINIQEI